MLYLEYPVTALHRLPDHPSDHSPVLQPRYDGVISKLYYEVDGIAQTGDPLVDVEVEGGRGIPCFREVCFIATWPSESHGCRQAGRQVKF